MASSIRASRCADSQTPKADNLVSHCPRIEHCELYPLFRLRASLRTWQLRYCEASYQECERYRLAERGMAMPQNLLPNGKLLPVVPKKEP
jgi:hypothetical protein